MIGIHTIGHRNIIVENNQEKGEDNNDTSITLITVLSTGGLVDVNLSGAQTDSGEFLRNAIQSGEIISERLIRGRFSDWYGKKTMFLWWV